ncbi:hypothetical protein OA84_05745 [Kaistella solincola]|uniref:Uncharacterized protein n=1 Tax=Kaistella solincola TaxID=510955 RepID=A0ABR4ZQT1_9FLAO|nr:hypothetical protein OA84_05745 [Kaistella solincola]
MGNLDAFSNFRVIDFLFFWGAFLTLSNGGFLIFFMAPFPPSAPAFFAPLRFAKKSSAQVGARGSVNS